MRALRAADDVKLLRSLRIPMRDGVVLAADLYLPDPDGSLSADMPETPMPVVMDYIPYRKDEVDPAAMRHYLELPRHGYAVARIDIRGTGSSEGHAIDEYVEQEQLDGYDAVEWLASQPWCDGHVNMLGISYGGFTALQVATLQPPHLTSIVPVDFTDDRYTDDCHYRGGLLRMYYDLGWYGARMIAWNAMPPDLALDDETAGRVWREHIDENEPYYLAWLRHQVDGPYWRQGSVAAIADRIVCPAFLIGGWRDGYPNPPIRLYERLAGPKKLLIGPWDHRYPDAAIPGPRIDHLHEVVRWLDHWCRDIDDGVMTEPPIVVYMQEAGSPDPGRTETPGSWRAEGSWPPAGATEHTLWLGADGVLAQDAVTAAPGGRDRLVYDPTVGEAGGLWSGGVPFGLPGDQRPDEARSLVYTSEPLDADLAILGRPRAIVHLTSSAAVIGVAASLSDVGPDGTSNLVAKGMLNVSRRDSLTDPAPLAPGEHAELRDRHRRDRLAVPGRSSHSPGDRGGRLAEHLAHTRTGIPGRVARRGPTVTTRSPGRAGERFGGRSCVPAVAVPRAARGSRFAGTHLDGQPGPADGARDREGGSRDPASDARRHRDRPGQRLRLRGPPGKTRRTSSRGAGTLAGAPAMGARPLPGPTSPSARPGRRSRSASISL